MAAGWLVWLCCVLGHGIALAERDAFHEELLLKPLHTGHVYAHFQFTTVWDVDIRDPEHCEYSCVFAFRTSSCLSGRDFGVEVTPIFLRHPAGDLDFWFAFVLVRLFSGFFVQIQEDNGTSSFSQSIRMEVSVKKIPLSPRRMVLYDRNLCRSDEPGGCAFDSHRLQFRQLM